MAFVEIDPRYRDALKKHGFRSARDFLNWPGVILSGHPARHILRVGTGDESYILKKEHQVPWRDRVASAWAGHGWASKSVREACVLTRLRNAGIPCSEVVATGEDGGQAFLLLREQRAMVDLREYLGGALTTAEQRALAESLGREMARIHAAGFGQPDLYAKHILVRPMADGFRFCFLDWQRSRVRRAVSWRCRQHDLAALDASLAEHLASDWLRIACLDAYLRETRRRGQAPPLAGVARAIRQSSERLLRRRKVRELRQPALPAGTQHLLWLEDGERLCIACDFHAELNGRLPDWLPQAPPPNPDGACVEHRLISFGGRTVHLVQRWSRIGGSLREGKFPTPELARAATLFRLQRFGVGGPRLLAMGHRQVGTRQHFSFLVTEPPTGPSLATALRTAPAELRRELLRQFETQMGKVQDAGYAFPPDTDPLQGWVVSSERVVLASDEPLTRKRESRTRAETEVAQ